jgi:hypothetical protein
LGSHCGPTPPTLQFSALSPGGQPIGALEAAFAKLGKSIRRFLKRRDKGLAAA